MIKIYTTSWCPYCVATKRLLTSRGKEYEEINIEEREMSREDLFEITGSHSVPQIVINDEAIGGYDNLVELDSTGRL